MIDKIITAYLKNNKRLVVPEFGAFIHKEGEEVVFVEFLKKDDQVLSSLLCREYSIDEADARSVIEEYVAIIRRSVGATGKYIIDGLGLLHTDVNGLYALVYDPRVRKEAAEINVVQRNEPEPEPAPQQPSMRVVTREQVEEISVTPSVCDDIVMPPRSEETSERRTKSHNIIEFSTQKQADTSTQPKPEVKKPFTLNDLYSIPADECSEEKHARPTPPQLARPATQQGERRTQPQRPVVQQDRRPQPVSTHTQFDEWEEDEKPRRRPANYNRRGKNKADWIMIFAIAAAAIALIAMAYGIFVRNGNPEIKPTNPPQIENTVETDAADDATGEISPEID